MVNNTLNFCQKSFPRKPFWPRLSKSLLFWTRGLEVFMFLTLLVRTRILMRLWSVTNFQFLSLVQADSMDQETQTKLLKPKPNQIDLLTIQLFTKLRSIRQLYIVWAGIPIHFILIPVLLEKVVLRSQFCTDYALKASPWGSHFFYDGKSWNGKKCPFADLKKVCHLTWKWFCHLKTLWND